MFSPDLAGDARHRLLLARARRGDARPFEVDALERRCESIRVALAPDLAVGDDVDAGALHVADGDDGRVVLGLLEELRRDAPDLPRANPRRQPAGKSRAVNEPVRLRIAADHRR